jgi:hypothetical protein
MKTNPECFRAATTFDMVSAGLRPRQRPAAGQSHRQSGFNVAGIGGSEFFEVIAHTRMMARRSRFVQPEPRELDLVDAPRFGMAGLTKIARVGQRE